MLFNFQGAPCRSAPAGQLPKNSIFRLHCQPIFTNFFSLLHPPPVFPHFTSQACPTGSINRFLYTFCKSVTKNLPPAKFRWIGGLKNAAGGAIICKRSLSPPIYACSSVDRAPASGAGCVGSIPIRRTTKNPCVYTGFSYYFKGMNIFSICLNVFGLPPSNGGTRYPLPPRAKGLYVHFHLWPQ